MNNPFRGTGIALVTPFQNGKIDFQGLEAVIEHTLKGGVEFLVSLGTTGESVTLSATEKLEVLSFTAEVVKGRVPLVAGFGGNHTAYIKEAIQSFDFKHYDAILSVSPAYNKPTQEGIYQHFMALEAVAPKPIILYNVPGRTSSNMTAETTLRLAHASKKFMAVKEASGDLVQCMTIVRDRPEGFLVLSGDDILTLPMLSFGMDGVISVIGNAFPKEFSDMVRFGLQGDVDSAKNLHLALLDLMQLIFTDGNPAGIKGILQMMGVCSGEVRLPLAPLTEPTAVKIKKAIEQMHSQV